jgi:hypothetical protein
MIIFFFEAENPADESTMGILFGILGPGWNLSGSNED